MAYQVLLQKSPKNEQTRAIEREGSIIGKPSQPLTLFFHSIFRLIIENLHTRFHVLSRKAVKVAAQHFPLSRSRHDPSVGQSRDPNSRTIPERKSKANLSIWFSGKPNGIRFHSTHPLISSCNLTPDAATNGNAFSLLRNDSIEADMIDDDPSVNENKQSARCIFL